MKRPLMAVCMCFVALAAALLLAGGPPDAVPDWDGREVTVTGHVYRKDTKYFYLDSILIQIQAAGQQQNFSLNDNLICEYEGDAPRIGSEVTACGTFQCFQSATNPGEFDVAGYYHSIGIAGKLRRITELTQSDSYSACQEALFQLRQYFRERLYEILPKKEASVMTAMLLGDKSDLDEAVETLYQENGIIHILSISGLHITIIGMSIYRLLRRMGIKVWVAAIMGGSILLLYGVMTGMSISACRAIGMFLIKMLAEVTGRTYDMLTALGIMAAGMVGSNLRYLQNAGFLLSFGAILGIGMLYPVLLQKKEDRGLKKYEERAWKRIIRELLLKIREGLRQSMFSGLSVTLTTLPVMLWFYYEVPTYSVFLNLLVLPFMTMVMLSGLLAMLVPGLGAVATVDYIILNGYEWLCKAFEQLPYSKWNPGRPEVWQVVVYYVILLGVVMLGWHREHVGKIVQSKRNSVEKEKRKGCIAGFTQYILLTIAVIALGNSFFDKTMVTFLDVGQGDCICVQLASGEVYLFDCGSTSRSKVGEYVLMPYLKYAGISYIDAVFVSHPDADHCNGIEELLANEKEWGITVGAAVTDIKEGEGWQTEDGRFLCLHPPANCDIEDYNAYSQCFYIELAQGMSLLLTGDVEDIGEEQLLAQLRERDIEDITILKVAHHGSKYSTSEEFLKQVQPKAAVISCGRNNSYGHPHGETLQRLEDVGSKVLTTPEYGAITIEIGKGIKVYGFKG